MKNQFLKISLRQITRHKLFSLVNIFGLSVGIASVILISLWVNDENSYDKYYKDYERIYRLTSEITVNGTSVSTVDQYYKSINELKETFPEISNIARLSKPKKSFLTVNDKKINEDRLYYADNSLITLLNIDLTQGELESVLNEPNTAIISTKMAEKLFGIEDVIGKTILLEGKTPLLINGIFNKLPENTHIKGDIFTSINNLSDHTLNSFRTDESCLMYIKLHENASATEMASKFPKFIHHHYGEMIESAVGISFDEFLEGGNNIKLFLQPISEVHFNKDYTDDIEPHGNKQSIYILSVISFIILIVAIINFINLSSAKALNRIKEISIKKIIGASRKSLIKQLTLEAIIYSLFALNIGLILVEFLLPFFNDFTKKELSVGYIENPLIILYLLLFGVSLGIVAGIYPASLISSFSPLSILNKQGMSKLKGNLFRNILIVIQFFISLSIITGTLVISKQLNYINNKDWGFNKEDILIVKNINLLATPDYIFKNTLEENENISNTSLSQFVPGELFTARTYITEGKSFDEAVALFRVSTGFDFLKTYKLKLTEGRFFSKDNTMDYNRKTAVINEAAAKILGFESAIGKKIYRGDANNLQDPITIIGVVKDFHFKSLHDKIQPAIIRPYWMPNQYLSVVVKKEKINETISFIKEKWEKISDQPFEYSFLSADLQKLHNSEQRNKVLFLIFSILSIIVSSLGLFGMMIYTISKRQKEIGIRKALGAPNSNITYQLMKQTLWLFVIATIVSVPISIHLMSKWLHNFAYHINLTPSIFFISTCIVLFISIATIIAQVIIASRENPVQTLKYE